MFSFSIIVCLYAVLCTGLMAGLFFSWSCSVVPGIKNLPDNMYLAAMQSMNKAILNPLFLIVFLSAPLAAVLSTCLQLRQPVNLSLLLFASGTVILLTGVHGLTIAGNVPLNEKLDAFNLRGAKRPDLAAFRLGFESSWNRMNDIRSYCSALAFACMLLSLGLQLSAKHL
ncbi:DUF1772 domain-containing protein [Pedobacter sp. SYP-B3415]|uniref:anthrone oxygenase family protein n=1 Tax=Pedobacter sp. SYP-B3415 TaxID=2496641 RepID=UPI0013ED50F9|nr:anthrone oxygenase family protein [Pedobacter sp. SYP-B3415]